MPRLQKRMSLYHNPVLLNECIEGLAIRPEGVYVDATYGGGGHSRAILSRLGEGERLVAFDQDPDAQGCAMDDQRFTLIGENFRHMKAFLRLNGIREVDGILADLGVSSHQLDDAGRGFSTRMDGPLDLRMDTRGGCTAAELVNTLDCEELTKLLRDYGELPNAYAMARAICTARAEKPLMTTLQLKEAVARLLPRGRENKYLAMLFQALRIEVNGELEALKQMLTQAVELLRPAGRLVVIAYHSLEDRLVKHVMQTGNVEGELRKDFYGNILSDIRPVCRKAIAATPGEVAANNRARSARLRIGEKVSQPIKTL